MFVVTRIICILQIFINKILFCFIIAIPLCSSVLYAAESPDVRSDQALEKEYNQTIDNYGNMESDEFLINIAEAVTKQAAGKYKDLKEKGGELPMNIHDPTVDCTEYWESLRGPQEKILGSISGIRKTVEANNNELTLWGTVKMVNLLRLVFQYAIVERPFTPGNCLDDKIEEEFVVRAETQIDEIMALTDHESPDPEQLPK